VRSEEAVIGMRVMVGESGLGCEWRGLTGTISGRWGNPEYLALEVVLEEGRTQLFWHHELEEIVEEIGEGVLAGRATLTADWWEKSLREETSVQKNQTVSEMAQEVPERQAKALAHRSGHSLEDASRAVADTETGRQLRDLANGGHRHEKAQEWQGSVFWERAEERLMHLFCSEALSRFAAERPYSRLEGYMEWLEGKEESAQYCALLEEELAGPRGDTLRRRASGASSEARKGCSRRAPAASVCRGRDISENPLSRTSHSALQRE
jgi:hypothetical protein